MADDTTYDDGILADEPMTEQQRIYLDTLAARAGEATPSNDLTRREALAKIEELHKLTGDQPDGSYDIDTEDDPTLKRDAS